MPNVYILLDYPEAGLVSDRSLRSILKSISKKLRVALLEEAMDFIESLPITEREKSGARSRLSGDVELVPVYFLREAKAGSLTLTLTLSAGLLATIIATELFKDAVKSTELYQILLDFLKFKRPEEIVPRIERALNGEAIGAAGEVREITISKQGEDYIVKLGVDHVDDGRPHPFRASTTDELTAYIESVLNKDR